MIVLPAPTLLLAKKPLGERQKGLAEHCREVMDAFEALFGAADGPTHLGSAWLRFFRLEDQQYVDLHKNGLAACGLHDLGKANDCFQDTLRNRGEQLIRHEHLSGMVLALDPLWSQLSEALDADIVLSAVIGHHLKASPQKTKRYPAFGESLSENGDSLLLYTDAPDFQQLLDQVGRRVGLSLCDATIIEAIPRYWDLCTNIAGRRDLVISRLHRFARALQADDSRRRLLWAVKAAVIAADTAASGLVREGHKITEWIEDAVGAHKRLTAADIQEEILVPRVRQIEDGRPAHPFAWQSWQDAAANLAARSLLLAPCGMGKTLAAWRWIQAQLSARPASRVLFLYPTRATATEGFRDYVSHAPESDAALLHGTARYELQGLFDNPEDDRHGRNYETEERLYALGYWRRRVFSATTDQFLGFMQQAYGGIALLPVLADSIVVFDEVHSFDVGLFDGLKKFLATFDVPALCMTASLPENRRRELEAIGLAVFRTDSGQFHEFQQRAAIPRYGVSILDSVEAAEEVAVRARGEGKRVLWVVNTVDRCQEIARRLNACCYHSRFTLEDRKLRHRSVIDAFHVDGPLLAVTTQVCEMSLDIDAQVLITETAPVTALIQRMGRCNRYARTAESPPGKVYVYAPENHLPYARNELAGGDQFLTALDGQPVSQARLEELLQDLTRDRAAEGDKYAAFLQDGPWARGGRETLRDTTEYTVPSILDTAVESFLEARARRQPTDGFILPAPNRLARSDTRLGSWPRVVPADHYHPQFGLFKEPLPESVR